MGENRVLIEGSVKDKNDGIDNFSIECGESTFSLSN